MLHRIISVCIPICFLFGCKTQQIASFEQTSTSGLNLNTIDYSKDIEPFVASVMKIPEQLEPCIWKDSKLDSEIRQTLNEIIDEFLLSLYMPKELVRFRSAIVTGTTADFNYSEFSDFDVHLYFDYLTEDETTQKLLLDYMQKSREIWNKSHNIMICGYELELYLTFSTYDGEPGPVYLLTEDEWLVRPQKYGSISVSKNDIVELSLSYLNKLQEIEKRMLMVGLKDYDCNHISDLRDDIYTMRSNGLTEVGQLAKENLTFKVVRRKVNSVRKQKYTHWLVTLDNHCKDSKRSVSANR